MLNVLYLLTGLDGILQELQKTLLIKLLLAGNPFNADACLNKEFVLSKEAACGWTSSWTSNPSCSSVSAAPRHLLPYVAADKLYVPSSHSGLLTLTPNSHHHLNPSPLRSSYRDTTLVTLHIAVHCLLLMPKGHLRRLEEIRRTSVGLWMMITVHTTPPK